jgi:CBS domain-containing protein
MLVSEILRIKGTTLYTTPPHERVVDAVKIMDQYDIGSLVVMDHGRMVGMVTFAEVLKLLAHHGDRSATHESTRSSSAIHPPRSPTST